MNFHIRGFGACMIGGYPYRYEDSFFRYAVEALAKESMHQFTTSLFTLGGFPITRVPKHFKSKCLDAKPDIVVLQFATSDLIVPIHRHKHRSRVAVAKPSAPLDQLRWQIQGLIGDALQLKSVTPPEIYVEKLVGLARTLQENGIVPVVISPFVFGGRRSDRIACDCGERLRQALASVPEAHFVDAYSALDSFPRSRMLIGDGTHLSPQGHRVVGDALVNCLKEVMEHNDEKSPVADWSVWDRLDELLHDHPGLEPLVEVLRDCRIKPDLEHEDFAPWNISVPARSGKAKRAALDWEHCVGRAMPGWDWIHFTLQYNTLVRRRSARATLAEIESLWNAPDFQVYARRTGIEPVLKELTFLFLFYFLRFCDHRENASVTRRLLSEFNWKYFPEIDPYHPPLKIHDLLKPYFERSPHFMAHA